MQIYDTPQNSHGTQKLAVQIGRLYMFLLFLELFSGSMLVFEAAHSTSVCHLYMSCILYTIGSTPKDVIFLHMTMKSNLKMGIANTLGTQRLCRKT